ncbi:MAG: RNA 2',3'-cyclic phosphodiesterase [Desulfobacula sp.]|nr:RNA 2',3'-cyclic phosphodiesterase [Desulfobacula sp.]
MKEDSGQIRSFIAVEIPETVKNSLENLQKNLSASGINASFSKLETLHLTLKFLGNIRLDDLDSLERSMEKAVAGILPHRLFAAGIGVFPSVKHARIIWSGIRGETQCLGALAAGLESVLFRELGMEKEKKIFRPHLTLARINHNLSPDLILSAIKTFENFHTPDFSVSGISLFQSNLSSAGAIHKQIFFIPFPLNRVQAQD